MIYRWKTRPFHHQVAATKTLLENGYGGALLMAPRTGKTKVAIDWISILHMQKKVHKVLVIAPLDVLGVWQEEVRKHSPIRALVLIWDKAGRKVIRLPAASDRLVYVVVNPDAFANVASRDRVKRQIRKWKPDCIILDESHVIKSPSAKKTTAIIGLAWMKKRDKKNKWGMVIERGELVELVPYRAILTGTPVTKRKRTYDIYTQWKFLNPHRFAEYPTFADFRSHFVRERDMQGYKLWLRNLHTEELYRKIHADSFAITREECFDLPKRSDQVIPVPLETNTKRIYDELAEEMVAEIHSAQDRLAEVTHELAEARRKETKTKRDLKKIARLKDLRFEAWRVTASIPLVAGLRLQQLTSGIAKVQNDAGEERLVRVSREKFNVCTSLLTNLLEADERIVVAARFRPDLDILGDWCRKRRIWFRQIRGGISRQERSDARVAFSRLDGPGVMLVHPKAASLGIDLSNAANMIWYSLTPSYVEFTQTGDRIALSNQSTSYQYLLAEGTYDYDLFNVLQEDGEVAAAISASPDRLLRSFKIAKIPQR